MIAVIKVKIIDIICHVSSNKFRGTYFCILTIMQYLLRKNEFISESRNILYGYFGTSSADRSHDKGQNIKVGGGEKDICEFVEILPENV